jgi:hypothetical protein
VNTTFVFLRHVGCLSSNEYLKKGINHLDLVLLAVLDLDLDMNLVADLFFDFFRADTLRDILGVGRQPPDDPAAPNGGTPADGGTPALPCSLPFRSRVGLSGASKFCVGGLSTASRDLSAS